MFGSPKLRTSGKRQFVEVTHHHRHWCSPNSKRQKTDDEQKFRTQRVALTFQSNQSKRKDSNAVATNGYSQSLVKYLKFSSESKQIGFPNSLGSISKHNLTYRINQSRREDYRINQIRRRDYRINPIRRRDYRINRSRREDYRINRSRREDYQINRSRREHYQINQSRREAYRINRSRREDSIGHSQALAKSSKYAARSKQIDLPTSLGSVSSCRLSSRINQSRKEDLNTVVADGNSQALVKSLKYAAQSKQIDLRNSMRSISGHRPCITPALPAQKKGRSEEEPISVVGAGNLQNSLTSSVVGARNLQVLLPSSKNAAQAGVVNMSTRLGSISGTRTPVTAALVPRVHLITSEEDQPAVGATGNLQTRSQSGENNCQAEKIGRLSCFGPISQFKPPNQAYDPPAILKNTKLDSSTKNSILARGMSCVEQLVGVTKMFGEKVQGRDPLKRPLNENVHNEPDKNTVSQQSNDLTIFSSKDCQRAKVKEVLTLYDELCSKLSHNQESRLEGQKLSSLWIRSTAARILKEQQKWVNTGRQLGAISGIDIGDTFHFMNELVMIGLHRLPRGGIDYMKEDGKFLATSIVASDRYDNNMSSSDVLIYSGQGGNPSVGYRQLEDQKLRRGNLALYNSMTAKNPVRVIRGFKAKNNIPTKYVYDGLYIVDNCWQERGKFGKLVFQFQLNRIPGQTELTKIVKFKNSEVQDKLTQKRVQLNNSGVRKRIIHKLLQFKYSRVRNRITQKIVKYNDSKVRNRLCEVDISQGIEKMPIGVVNNVDDEKPQSFTYITTMMYPEWYKSSMPKGCGCTDGCLNTKNCSCALKNGGEILTDNNKAIVKEKTLFYECGPSCNCSSSCNIRVSQHGIRFSLEVFKTQSNGWGVRSRDYISSGSFVCEYVGELLQESEARRRIDSNEYSFDIGSNFEIMDGRHLIIDAKRFGNAGRFINRSSLPNLYAKNVLYDHCDKTTPHIMLFAIKNIPPLRELTYDYNSHIAQVSEWDGLSR